MHFKTSSKWLIQRVAEATGDLIANKIANKITRVSKNSQQHNLKTVTNEHEKEIPKENLQKKDKKLLIIWYLI